MAWQSRHGHAYDEPAFRYLLALEQRRSARGGCSHVLVLVELESDLPGGRRHRTRLFSALAGCARETDIIGWYRRDRVASVVFTELGGRPLAEVSQLLRGRVVAALERALHGTMAYRVQLRIHRCPPPAGRVGKTTRVGEDECSISE